MSDKSCCECGKEINGEGNRCMVCDAEICEICSDMCEVCLGYVCDSCKTTHNKTH